jgi:hypothetical protein
VRVPAYRAAHAGDLLFGLRRLQRKGELPRAVATKWHDGQISKKLSSRARENIPLNEQPKSAA